MSSFSLAAKAQQRVNIVKVENTNVVLSLAAEAPAKSYIM